MPTRFAGQPLKRLEDARLLRGQATFLDDLRLSGARDVAFVRSIHPHARFRIDASAARAIAGVVGVFVGGDLHPAKEIPTVVDHPALRPCRHPLLADDKVRYVGEQSAAVVADNRDLAEDGAEGVQVQYDPLPAVPDARAAVAAGAALLHDGLEANIAADFTVRVGDADAAFRSADVTTRATYYVHRYTGMPLESRGVAAAWDAGTGQLTLWSSTQWPHTLRDALRDVLRLPEHRIRVVAPDVGGGFGVKQEIYPEEIVLARLAMLLHSPVKWVATRREHLLTTAHAREQWHDVELAARRDGTILALRAEILADVGAYTRSLGVLCPSITAASLPGAYRIRDYTCRVRAALTCKAPAAAYRGAGQPEAVFAIERALDHLLPTPRMDPGGGVRLVTGASPHGQGTATMLAQVVADELGIQPHEVSVRHGDTALIPFGVGTYASRNAVVAGSAALIAARIVAIKARRLAAHLLEVSDADLELADGVVRVVGAPDRRLSLAELATACAPGSPLPEGMEPGLEATHYFAAPRATFASGVHVATVEIERETGRIAIIDYTVVSDAGRVINPLIVEGQIHGGVAQGVGGALYEELVYDEQGQPRTQSLLEYVMPTAEQVPSMKIANLVTPSPLNPLGVKGIGEAGALAPPAAITAAVEDALRPFGARITSTPLRPEDIFRLMHSA